MPRDPQPTETQQEHDPVLSERGWSYCRVCGYVLGRRNRAKPCRGPAKLRPFEEMRPATMEPSDG